nr:helix-turn-helix domain-containing protein [Frondihabitans sp. VKM Ac-2883]
MYPVETSALPPGLLIPRNAHVRTAVEYIHEHPHLPITTTDLARIANVSLRTLQETFQRLLGMTPNAYLRQVRLDRIHHKLLAAEPAGTVIADVARTWGFNHPGRFAAAYTARFGCYPRDTLGHTAPASRR